MNCLFDEFISYLSQSKFQTQWFENGVFLHFRNLNLVVVKNATNFEVYSDGDDITRYFGIEHYSRLMRFININESLYGYIEYGGDANLTNWFSQIGFASSDVTIKTVFTQVDNEQHHEKRLLEAERVASYSGWFGDLVTWIDFSTLPDLSPQRPPPRHRVTPTPHAHLSGAWGASR